METNNAATATSDSPKKLYPFLTKAQIKARLSTDHGFCCQAILILYALQTEHEQAKSTTVDRNRHGFMSSHAVRGTALAKKLQAGDALTDEESAQVDEIASHYSRQLAVYFRAQEITNQPALREIAALFGVAAS